MNQLHLVLRVAIASILLIGISQEALSAEVPQPKEHPETQTQTQKNLCNLQSTICNQQSTALFSPMLRLKDFSRSATTLREWIAQIKKTENESPVQVIGVKLNPTDTELEIVLETQDGRPLQIEAQEFTTQGNTLIANIPNAVLALPDAQEFSVDNPTQEIANVRVMQLNATSIRVSVAGKNALPAEAVTLKAGSLSYSLNPEEEEEIIVTGELNGSRYFTPNASSATRTDTPIRDTPASIQVVPQQVIEDQQVVRVEEALRNVSSVIFRGNNDSRGSNFSIRGFDNVPVLRDGFRLYNGYGGLEGLPEVANLERIEVLKGPASILYGEIQPGGVINLVSKKPLSTPFHEVELQVGSRNFVRPRFDFSGPVTSNGNVLYRLNGLYQQGNSFRDYDEQARRFSIAPALTWKISDRTDLTVALESINDKNPADFGVFAVGDRIVNVPRNRVPNNPDDTVKNTYLSAGYNFEHRFSDKWKILNSFRYVDYKYEYSALALPFGVDENTGILNRVFASQEGNLKSYSLFTNLVGKFAIGSVNNTLLFGVDLNRSEQEIISVGDFNTSIPLNIFAPNYNLFPKPNRSTLPVFDDFNQNGDRLGIYLQDQISLFEDTLILLAGLRYDTVKQTSTETVSAIDRSRQDDAVTPRLGIVYHPIPELSLYASYARSFNPSQSVSASGEILEPEEGEGFEVGVKAELLNRKLFATVSYFDITKQNVAVADPVLLNVFTATGEQRSRGVELDVNGEILPGWNVIVTYAYTDAEVTKDANPRLVGSHLVNIPEHSVGLWTTYEIQTGSLQGLGFGFGFNYVGERRGGLPNSFRVGSYFVPNAAIFYRRDQWRLNINFKNLSNANYIESVSTSKVRGNYPGEPFTVLSSVSYEF